MKECQEYLFEREDSLEKRKRRQMSNERYFTVLYDIDYSCLLFSLRF